MKINSFISDFDSVDCLFVTFDGSSYFSTHYMDHSICYDYYHVNSFFKIFVLNRIVNVHDLDSFFFLYDSLMFLPSFEDSDYE